MNILEKILGSILNEISEGNQDKGKVINNNITQNINTGISYMDVERIAENVVDRKLSENTIQK